MSITRLGSLQWAIILLAAATAVIHLWLGIPNAFLMFILNGIGYLALVAALYLPQMRRYQPIVRWALILYTAVTIIAWVAIGQRNAIGMIDKLIEAALIACLLVEARRA